MRARLPRCDEGGDKAHASIGFFISRPWRKKAKKRRGTRIHIRNPRQNGYTQRIKSRTSLNPPLPRTLLIEGGHVISAWPPHLSERWTGGRLTLERTAAKQGSTSEW